MRRGTPPRVVWSFSRRASRGQARAVRAVRARPVCGSGRLFAFARAGLSPHRPLPMRRFRRARLAATLAGCRGVRPLVIATGQTPYDQNNRNANGLSSGGLSASCVFLVHGIAPALDSTLRTQRLPPANRTQSYQAAPARFTDASARISAGSYTGSVEFSGVTISGASLHPRMIPSHPFFARSWITRRTAARDSRRASP